MDAFIFDFDGVIVDSELYWDTHSVASFKEIVPAFTEEYDRQLKGRNGHDIYDMLVRDFGLSIEKEEFMSHLAKFAEKIYNVWSQLLPGIPDLVELLQHHKIPVGIASSSEHVWIESTLKRLGMDGIFSPIVTARDVGIGKPDPAVYLEAAKRLNVAPEHCMALEDSTNGLRSAKAAGMKCIGLHHIGTYSQDLSAADLQIHEIDELTWEVLERL